jgi:uncharacterized membrane protein YqaE (UPF0057 family)
MKKFFTRLMVTLLTAFVFAAPAIAASASQPVPVRADSSTPGQPDKSTIDAALKEFKSLDRKDRRSRIKESRKWLKEYRADVKSGKAKRETDHVLLIILCILLPPLAVYLKEDEINYKFWLSILLTLLFWLPGIIYALLVVFDEV